MSRIERGPISDIAGDTPPGSPWRVFLQDLKWGVGTWRREPSVPIIVGLVFAGVAYSLYIPLIVLWLVFPLRLAAIGFYAVPWGFYLRASRGKRLPWSDMPPIVWRYFRRFFRLGVIVLFFFAIPLLLLAVSVVHRQGSGESNSDVIAHLPLWYWFASGVVTFAMDALLTFAAPALVYSTDSALEALRYGIRYVRQTWPSSAFYVLTPGITLTSIGIALPPSVFGVGGKVVLAGLGAIIGFAFKGAIAPFYLRGHQGRTDRLPLITSFFVGDTSSQDD